MIGKHTSSRSQTPELVYDLIEAIIYTVLVRLLYCTLTVVYYALLGFPEYKIVEAFKISIRYAPQSKYANAFQHSAWFLAGYFVIEITSPLSN